MIPVSSLLNDPMIRAWCEQQPDYGDYQAQQAQKRDELLEGNEPLPPLEPNENPPPTEPNETET